MAEGQKATEKGTTPDAVFGNPVDPTTGEVPGQWEVQARFVGFQAPKGWNMTDERTGQPRSGTVYRVDVRVPEGTVLMKVPELVYKEMESARLDFGDKIAMIYGRTVVAGEMRVAPIGFRRA